MPFRKLVDIYYCIVYNRTEMFFWFSQISARARLLGSLLIGEDESFYLYQKCQSILYYALNHNNCNEVALVYSINSHEEGNMIKGSQ